MRKKERRCHDGQGPALRSLGLRCPSGCGNATEQRQLCRMTSCQCRQGSGAYREFWKGQLDLWTITWKVHNDMPGKAKPSATVRLPAAVIRCCRGWAEPLGRRCGCRASFAGVSCHVRPVCVPEAVKQAGHETFLLSSCAAPCPEQRRRSVPMRRNIRIAKRSLGGRAFLLCLLLVAVGGIGGCGGRAGR